MNIDFASLLEWQPPVRQSGKLVSRAFNSPPAFWAQWRANKEAVKAAGIRVKPAQGGGWEITWTRDESEGSIAVPDALAQVLVPEPRKSLVLPAGLKLSDEQISIVNWFRDGKGNLVVRARAGTGKTFTIIIAIGQAPERRKLYAVFGKENQLEAEGKISDPNVDVMTLNALGYRIIRSVWPSVKPDNQVEKDRIAVAAGRYAPEDALAEILKLVSFAKNVFLMPTVEQLEDLAEARLYRCSPESEINGWTVRKLAEVALAAMQLATEKDLQGRIAFGDQCWLPVVMGWVRPCYDLVVVDECQDMNLAQLLLAQGVVAQNGRMAVVGDDWQAIFGFRGAAEDGLDMMKTRLSAVELGLTVTRRCPKVVVAKVLAETLVSDYKAADDAPEGEYLEIGKDLLVASAQVGDVILSRANAPLMPVCLQLLAKGTPARIRGRDVGAQLAGIIRKLKPKSVPHAIERVTNWGEAQKNRFKGSKSAEAQAEMIDDQVACIVALCDGCVNISEVYARIDDIFQDAAGFQKPCVTLSSTHKAKGLEWNRVFLLAKTYAKGMKGGRTEEARLYYVAMTRAKNTLVHVLDRKSAPENN